MDKLIKVKDMAEYLNTTEKAIYAKVMRNQIPYIKFGTGRNSSIRFKCEDIEKWISVHSCGPRMEM